MPTQDEILVGIAPELEAIDSARRTLMLSLAGLRVSATAFGSSRDLAVAYLAAHMLSISAAEIGASGPITERQEGELRIKYASTIGGYSDFERTSYGQEYQNLIKSLVVVPRVRSLC